ncbi:hypothetical protein VTL71DRAFT_7489 [Oculimacula yallundae]|uniref:Uncharacterized protein n=1 Tax=Oculimacula yallundae TaxID=86028 RepID=A0ABR4BVT2_9HELO
MDDHAFVEGRDFAIERPGEVRGSEKDTTPAEIRSLRSKKRKVLWKDKEVAKEPETTATENKCPQCRLSNGDLTPDPIIMSGSCTVVEHWMEHCDAAAASTRHERNVHTPSMVFTAGGVQQRPKLDVGAWKMRRKNQHPREGRLRKERSVVSDISPAKTTTQIRNINQNLDEAAANTMLNRDLPIQKVNIVEKLLSALYSKKTVMNPMEMEQEPKMQDNQQLRRVRFDDETNSRRRTRREKFKAEVKSPIQADDPRRMSTTTQQEKISDRPSYISTDPANSKKHVGQDMEEWDSDTYSRSSILSSRVSEINLGSILGHPNSPPAFTPSNLDPRPQMSPRRFIPSAPKPIPAWESSSRSQSRISLGARTSKETAASSSSSRQVGVPPDSYSSMAPSLITRSDDNTEFAKNRERRRQERNVFVPASVSKEPISHMRSEMDRRTALPMAKDLRTRRAERSRIPATERYYRDERERFWSSQKVGGETKG